MHAHRLFRSCDDEGAAVTSARGAPVGRRTAHGRGRVSPRAQGKLSLKLFELFHLQMTSALPAEPQRARRPLSQCSGARGGTPHRLFRSCDGEGAAATSARGAPVGNGARALVSTFNFMASFTALRSRKYGIIFRDAMEGSVEEK